MKRLMILVGALLLAGCGALDSGLRYCEAQIKGKLRSPATYHRVSYEKQELYGGYKYKIEYDADNAYGAPIRATEYCTAAG